MPNWREAINGPKFSWENLTHIFNLPSNSDIQNLWDYAGQSWSRTGAYTHSAASFANAVDKGLTNANDSLARRMLEKKDPNGDTALMIAEKAENPDMQNAEMINVLLKHSVRLGILSAETAEKKLRPVRPFNPYSDVSDEEYAKMRAPGLGSNIPS